MQIVGFKFHQHVCNLGGQNGHAVKLSPVLIPELQKTLVLKVSLMSTTHVEAGSSQNFLVSHPDHRVHFHQQLCHLGSPNGFTVKLSPVLNLEPQNTDVMSMCLMLRMLAGGASDCQQRTGDSEEAAVQPETTGRRSVTSEPAPIAFMKSSCAPQLEVHVNALLFAYTTGGSTACRAQLAELPEIPADDSLSYLPREFEDVVGMFMYDRVTSDAALQVRHNHTDTMLYPLAVLLHASAAAEGLPVVFFITSSTQSRTLCCTSRRT